MTKITQLGTLKKVRRPLPPARKVILDKKTKLRRKRCVRLSYETHSDWNSL